jgi:precorrin-6A/cobalt-precorrin-6A reductase
MILLIGGTSETAPLASGLAAAGYEVLVSTATAVPLAIGENPLISRRTGRLDEEGLVALGNERGVRAIVDAAHPYAVAAHAAAANAARRLGIPCLVFRRPEELTPDTGHCPDTAPADDAALALDEDRPASAVENPATSGTGGREAPGSPVRFAADHAEAAVMAFALGRPVLLTTGSRNLAPYAEAAPRTGVPLIVRVLDAPESLAACREAGIPEDRIIAGRGPFSVEENLIAIRRFGIGVIVTKESGRAGGFDAKLAAARQANGLVIVIRRPETPASGLAFDNPATLIAALQDLVQLVPASPGNPSSIMPSEVPLS